MTVTLKKSGDSHRISLAKQDLNVHVNLNWQAPKPSGFLSKVFAAAPPDLDLGCMFELVDGRKGVIQPLGGNFGSKSSEPFIFLDKDDRSGAAADGENLYLYKPALIKRVMLFAMIYKGATDFRSVGGRMFFKVSNGERVELDLNSPSPNLAFCSAALISCQNGEVRITKEERYFSGHREADQHYGFGFNWTAGSK
jgi:tellurite resistance protein TerA